MNQFEQIKKHWSESGCVKPEVGSLHIFNGVRQGLTGGLRHQQGEGRAQQRAQATQHHRSLRTDVPQKVHHGSQDPSSPGTHGADTDPILSVSDGGVRRQRVSEPEGTPSLILLSQFLCCHVSKQLFSYQRHFSPLYLQQNKTCIMHMLCGADLYLTEELKITLVMQHIR